LQWFLESSALITRKKQTLQLWKSSRSQKKTSDHVGQHASLVGDVGNMEGLGHHVKVNHTITQSPDVKAKILKWQIEKEDIERSKKEEEDMKLLKEKNKTALAMKRNQLKRAQVLEWRQMEEKKLDNEANISKIEREKKTQLAQKLELRKTMDMEIAKRRHEKRELKSCQLASRQEKLRQLDPKLELLSDVKRDPLRLLSSTKASDAYKISSEYLDEADRRRTTANAHSTNIALNARDLQFKGRACPEWRRGISQ